MRKLEIPAPNMNFTKGELVNLCLLLKINLQQLKDLMFGRLVSLGLNSIFCITSV